MSQDNLPKHRIYVVIRTDISPVQQAVQIAHASAEAGSRFYRTAEHGVASIILVEAPDATTLEKAKTHLTKKGIEHTVFFEPDWGMGESALGTRPMVEREWRYFMGWKSFRACPAPAVQQA